MLFNNEIIQSDNLFNFFTSICYYKIVLLSLLGTFYFIDKKAKALV